MVKIPMNKNTSSGNVLAITLSIIALIASFIVWRVMSPDDIHESSQKYSLVNSSQQVQTTEGVISDSLEQKAGFEKLYTNPSFGFSFMYPKEFTIGSFQQESIVTILVQNAEKNSGVQIVISPFDEDGDITAARIQSDIPELKMTNAKTIPLASGRTGLAFTADYSSFGGPSDNIWFAYKGNLYQLSAPSSSDGILSELFSIWKFL